MDVELLKKMAGEYAAMKIKDGMVVGLGTGTTVKYTILKIGQLVKEGLDIIGIPTSKATENLARSLGIKIGSLSEYEYIDITVDGADEVDKKLNLIKGGGGALLREKMIAYYSKYEVIVVDERKLSEVLGSFPLPVEIVPFGYGRTLHTLSGFGCVPHLRLKDGRPFVTDNGNYIVDCKFDSIDNPSSLNIELNSVPGVVENGLFVGLSNEVIVGTKNGIKVIRSDV